MKFCKCGQPVFGKGFCKSHQYQRSDFDSRSILQRGMDKQKQNEQLKSKVRGLGIKASPQDSYDMDEKIKKEKWFNLVRAKLTGTCQCGCANKSQKEDNKFFRHSCCHIFPKSKFHSVQYHPMNFVERSFWGGCHGVMDDTSMDRWAGMDDFDDIIKKFNIIAPLLSTQERSSKFFTHLEKLVNVNSVFVQY